MLTFIKLLTGFLIKKADELRQPFTKNVFGLGTNRYDL